MAKQQDKKRKNRSSGSAKRSPTTYEKYFKRGKGNRIRTRKGVNPVARACAINDHTGIGATILNFNGKRVILECGAEYSTLEDKLEVFHSCTKPKGHNGFHGRGSGFLNA